MAQPSEVDGDEFRPDIEGLRAVAVVVVVLFHARIARFSGGYVGVDVFFVAVRISDHPAAAARGRQNRHDLAAPLLGAPGASAASGVVRGRRRHRHRRAGAVGTDRPATARNRRPRRRRLRDQLRFREPTRRLLRIPTRSDAFAAAALLVAGGGGTVLSVLAARAPRPSPPATPVSTAGHGDDDRRRRRVVLHLFVDDSRPPDGRVLSPAGAHVGAGDRRTRRGRRLGMATGVADRAGRGRVDRRRRRCNRGRDVRRLDRVPRVGCVAASARHGLDRHRWGRARRRSRRSRSFVIHRCNGSAGGPTRSISGTGPLWCSPRRNGDRCRSPNGSSRSVSLWRSPQRRYDLSRIRFGTRRGSRHDPTED